MDPLTNPACDLPDLPRWVEPRAAVLSGECDIFGMPGENACIIRSTRIPLATVVGRPSRELLLRAIDLIGPEAELMVMHEDAEHVRAVLRYWRELPVTLHTRPENAPAPAGAEACRGIRIYDPWQASGKRGLAESLKQTLKAATIVAAKRVDGQVAAVCYTDAVTEQWWDVGVSTLKAHRRRGYARACFAALDRYMLARGKHPVWGARDDNAASLKMARSLGFEPADHVLVFASPQRKGR